MADEVTVYKSQKWDVPLMKQDNSNECWITSYEMMYGYKKMPIGDVRTKLSAKGLDLTKRLLPPDYGKARDAVGLTSYRVGYLTESWDNFASLLAKVGPLWCVGAFLTTRSGLAAHCMVVSGFDGSQKLRINDPDYIWKNANYDNMTYTDWCTKIAPLAFSCQCFA